MRRFPEDVAQTIQTGPSIEKSLVPLTGAKGLNLAFSDVYYLSRGPVEAFKKGNTVYLDSCSETALKRIWAAENTSWRLTKLLHVFPDEDSFDQKLRENDYDLLQMSEPAQKALAYEYIGLPY